jgi:hypothetical protein
MTTASRQRRAKGAILNGARYTILRTVSGKPSIEVYSDLGSAKRRLRQIAREARRRHARRMRPGAA